MNFKAIVSIVGICLGISVYAQSEVWTLESSLQQTIKVSPYTEAAEAEVQSAEGNVSQSGAWPNPTIGATGNNRLGIEDGQGGNEITQLSISQGSTHLMVEVYPKFETFYTFSIRSL